MTINPLEKTHLPFCGSFRGFRSLVWFVKISGSRSLASAPIDSVELVLSLGLVLPSPLLTTKKGDPVCDSTSCLSEGELLALSAVKGSFPYFAAAFRLTMETRSRKTKTMTPRHKKKTR